MATAQVRVSGFSPALYDTSRMVTNYYMRPRREKDVPTSVESVWNALARAGGSGTGMRSGDLMTTSVYGPPRKVAGFKAQAKKELALLGVTARIAVKEDEQERNLVYVLVEEYEHEGDLRHGVRPAVERHGGRIVGIESPLMGRYESAILTIKTDDPERFKIAFDADDTAYNTGSVVYSRWQLDG